MRKQLKSDGGVLAAGLLILSLVPILSCVGLGSSVDQDASPEGATPLQLGEAHEDRLNCGDDPGGDCVDWFAIEFPDRAQLRIDLKTVPPAQAGGAAPALSFSLHSEGGKRLRRRGPGASLRTQRTSNAGSYRVRVQAGETKGPVAYRLTVRSEPLRLARWTVLEANPIADSERIRVLISGGSDDGLKVGFLGRLVSGEKTLVRAKVVEVYPEGALVETLDPLAGPLSADAEAEIELPPGR